MTVPLHVVPSLVDAGPVGRLPDDGPFVVAVGDTTIVLFQVAQGVFAIEDCCLRCGRSLAEGSVAGVHVKCAGCGWDYDLSTGAIRGLPSIFANTFDVKIVDGRVMIAGRLAPNVPAADPRPRP
jgi:nitrite reductase/ring-hydroxylating ferredoxin subunit